MRLESAPVPVTGNRGSDFPRLSIGLGVLEMIRFRHRNTVLSIHVGLDLIEALRASLIPAKVGTPAEIAGTGWDTIGVEASILVQRHKVRSVSSAEDVATVTTVVATQEDAEGGATGRRITIGGGRVSLKCKVSICM
jgi:hypothetical protein